jgi:hypothetical protein
MSADAGLLRLAGVRIFEVDDLAEGALYVTGPQVLFLEKGLDSDARHRCYERTLKEVVKRVTPDEL